MISEIRLIWPRRVPVPVLCVLCVLMVRVCYGCVLTFIAAHPQNGLREESKRLNVAGLPIGALNSSAQCLAIKPFAISAAHSRQ